MTPIAAAVSEFGDAVAERFATGGGEPEDLLRGPLERLIRKLGANEQVGPVVLTGEHHLAEHRIRPDYAVYVGGALVGFIEVKAPGRGVDTSRYKGHDRQQWERLARLPNVLYTDGQEFALFRDGERAGEVVRLVGDVETAGAALSVSDGKLGSLMGEFLRWAPLPPRRPKELADVTARLCRVLRDEVEELLDSGNVGMRDLARTGVSSCIPMRPTTSLRTATPRPSPSRCCSRAWRGLTLPAATSATSPTTSEAVTRSWRERSPC